MQITYITSLMDVPERRWPRLPFLASIAAGTYILQEALAAATTAKCAHRRRLINKDGRKTNSSASLLHNLN